MSAILPEDSVFRTGDPLAITNRARALLGQNDPLALELFYMGRRHALAVQEARAQIAMYAFLEGLDPNYDGTATYEWTRLANAGRVWSAPESSEAASGATPAHQWAEQAGVAA